MLVRIVKLNIKKENIAKFEAIFAETKAYIRNSEGCLLLELYQENQNPSLFFTYSHWEDESFLDKYRQSPFFRDVWGRTKQLFAAAPEAWSVHKLESLN
ncbi:antibiotic biosynthesis monooxygenase [Flavobacteriaceae bacterium D16]|nr:antibiotic biosynthesis monooxygenase [Flavobacteriaceae bacterium D16]